MKNFIKWILDKYEADQMNRIKYQIYKSKLIEHHGGNKRLIKFNYSKFKALQRTGWEPTFIINKF